ncbi:MAG TPA: hypothetical protein VK502_01795, partial [Candidatus Saccharimonadales bacterium]|nr:hypothetical protein [Candidatus Saccharimonadales bacterium]
NSTNIVPACNVLTIDDFTQQKLYLGANSLPTVITRTYIDGVGKAPLDPSEYTLPSTGDANKCFYTLEQSDGFVGVTVYQPPLVANGAVQDTLSRSYAPTTVAGLDSAVRVFKNTKNRDGETTYMLQIGDVSAEVLLRIGQSKATDSLLQLASKNIMSLQKNAQGVAPANYNSPTFKKSVVRACDLMSNDDIKSLTGNDASQFVDESLATATGVVSQANSDGSFQYYNYIQNSCDRYNSGIGSGLVRGQAFDQKLDVTATSFQDDQGAKNGFASTKKGAANAVAAKVGDEALGYKDSAGQNTMVLRQGRFIIEMVFNRTLQRNGLENTATMTEKLTPYAQSVAGRLKEFDKGL